LRSRHGVVAAEPLRRDEIVSAALDDSSASLSNALNDCKSGANNDIERKENESSDDVEPKDTFSTPTLRIQTTWLQAKPPSLAVKKWAHVIFYKDQETDGFSMGAEGDTAKTFLIVPLQTQEAADLLYQAIQQAMEQC
jgi:hypothetical protein